MQAEVNATVEGAVAGGAAEVVVNDSHGGMANLDPAALPRAATYLSGRHKPAYMMQGLDRSFDAVLFVGYHGSISGAASVLSHTYNPEVISGVRLNGEPVGESGVNALVALAYEVPIALVAGDDVTIAEAQTFAPDAVFVQTKTSTSRFAAHHLHPARARELLSAGASRALRAVASGPVGLPRISLPVALEVTVQTADMAEVASWVKGVERTATRTVAITGSDCLGVYQSFVALTYITRQAGGR